MSTVKSTNQRANCFTLLRYTFFFCIFCNHFVIINGSLNTPFNGLWFVQGFFIISGILVFNSYERSKSNIEFFLKRFLRIYPAYFITIICCFIIGIIVTNLPLNEFFSNRTTWKYLFANLCFGNFLQPTLPGVFENNPLPYLNGSLWTLKVEIMFYLTVPLVAHLLKRYNRNLILISIITFSVVWDITTSQLYYMTENKIFSDLNHQIFGELSYFYFPILLYNYRDILLKRWWVLFISISLLLLQQHIWQLCYLNCFSISIIILYLAYKPTFLFPISNITDYSYEMYLLRFPILQLLCLASIPANYFTLSIALIIIFLIAYVLNHICNKFSYKNLLSKHHIQSYFYKLKKNDNI